VFGSIAAFVGAASLRRSVALGIGLTVAIACFVVYSLAPIVGVMDDINPFNPMQWTIGSESLKNGLDIVSCIQAIACSLVPMFAATYVFSRRDLAA
jgi:ABC-type transport system involved in multi-copper enzyme maturation permease subunit